MAELVARTKAPYILTHRRGDAMTMDTLTDYNNVAEEVVAELGGVRDKLYAAGVAPEQIIMDPGSGFLQERGPELGNPQEPGSALSALGHKVMVAASRKRFLGSLLTVAGKSAAPAGTRPATAAITALSATKRRLGCPRARRRPQP